MESQSIFELTNIDMFKSKISKISLVVILATFSFIFFLPKKISENPFLSKFFNAHSQTVMILWLISLGLIGLYTILSFFIETSAKNKILKFELESKQELIFCDFLNVEVARYNGEFLGAVFNTQDLSRYILESENIFNHTLLGKLGDFFYNVKTVNELVAMAISETIVKKAEYKRLIKKTDDFPTLSESYEILIEYMN